MRWSKSKRKLQKPTISLDRSAPGFEPRYLRERIRKERALVHPPHVLAKSLLYELIPDDEFVLGVAGAGEAKVYPTSMLRHLVNDRLGEESFVLSFCLRCFSGVAFKSEVENKVLTFDEFGVYQGSFVMRDRETGSLWAQETGECLSGSMAGLRLDPIPVEVARFKDWLGTHPLSLAPDPNWAKRFKARHPGEFRIQEEWMETVSNVDERLPMQTLVLGVEVKDRSAAYVLDSQDPGPRLYEDRLGEIPIVLLAEPGAWPLAYERRARDIEVHLSQENDRIQDANGGTWTADGLALTGPLKGTTLKFVRSHVVEWYTWAATRPDTEIRILVDV